MTKEDWQKIHLELYDLMEEFYAKWRKNDFKYKTELNQNNKRVSEIINTVVRIIRKNKELEDVILKDKDDDYIKYMEATGFWVESVFYSYMNRIMDEIESKID
jgi:predicted AlkP superfamily phosphohydrolase/phosphomutase